MTTGGIFTKQTSIFASRISKMVFSYRHCGCCPDSDLVDFAREMTHRVSIEIAASLRSLIICSTWFVMTGLEGLG